MINQDAVTVIDPERQQAPHPRKEALRKRVDGSGKATFRRAHMNALCGELPKGPVFVSAEEIRRRKTECQISPASPTVAQGDRL
jgi:hypothetical protein